jgi:ribosomal protein L24
VRILIIGVPRSGKTTLSEKLATGLDIEPVHTDDYLTVTDGSFDGVVALTMEQILKDEDMIVEGVPVVKAMERLIREGNLPFIDTLYYLPTAFIQSDKHTGFKTMVRNSFDAIKGELAQKGVRIIFK